MLGAYTGTIQASDSGFFVEGKLNEATTMSADDILKKMKDDNFQAFLRSHTSKQDRATLISGTEWKKKIKGKFTWQVLSKWLTKFAGLEAAAPIAKKLFEGKLTERLARGLKPLLQVGTTINKNVGEAALVKLSDKFDRVDDEVAEDVASYLNMAIEHMQDGNRGQATRVLKAFNKACKDVLADKPVKSVFEGKLNEDHFKKGQKVKYQLDRGSSKALRPSTGTISNVKKMGNYYQYTIQDGGPVPVWGAEIIGLAETKSAPAGHYFTKGGNVVKGRLSKAARSKGATKSDPKDKQRSKVPPATQRNESAKDKFGAPPMNKWWTGDKDALMSAIYHAQRQLPPTNKAKYEENWKSIVKQLQKKFPAPTAIYRKRLNEDYSQRARNFRVILRKRLADMKPNKKVKIGKLFFKKLPSGDGFTDNRGKFFELEAVVQAIQKGPAAILIRQNSARSPRGAQQIDAYLKFEGKLTEVQAMNMDTVPYNTVMKMKPGSTIKMKDGKIRTKDKFGNWRANTDRNDIIVNRDIVKHMKGMKGYNMGGGRIQIEGKLTERIGHWTGLLEDLIAFGFGNLVVKYKGATLGKVKDFEKLSNGSRITQLTFNYLLKKGGLKHNHARNRAELGSKASKYTKGTAELTEKAGRKFNG